MRHIFEACADGRSRRSRRRSSDQAGPHPRLPATRAGWLSTQLADERRGPPQADLPEGDPPTRRSSRQVREMLLGHAEQRPDADLAEEHPPPRARGGETLAQPGARRLLRARGFTSLLQSALEAYFDEHAPGDPSESRPSRSVRGWRPTRPYCRTRSPAVPCRHRRTGPAARRLRDHRSALGDERRSRWAGARCASRTRSTPRARRPRPLAPDARLVLVPTGAVASPGPGTLPTRCAGSSSPTSAVANSTSSTSGTSITPAGSASTTGTSSPTGRSRRASPSALGHSTETTTCTRAATPTSATCYSDPRFADTTAPAGSRSRTTTGSCSASTRPTRPRAQRSAGCVGRGEAARSNPDRRTVLLSHHQLFSAYGSERPESARSCATRWTRGALTRGSGDTSTAASYTRTTPERRQGAADRPRRSPRLCPPRADASPARSS